MTRRSYTFFHLINKANILPNIGDSVHHPSEGLLSVIQEDDVSALIGYNVPIVELCCQSARGFSLLVCNPKLVIMIGTRIICLPSVIHLINTSKDTTTYIYSHVKDDTRYNALTRLNHIIILLCIMKDLSCKALNSLDGNVKPAL